MGNTAGIHTIGYTLDQRLPIRPDLVFMNPYKIGIKTANHWSNNHAKLQLTVILSSFLVTQLQSFVFGSAHTAYTQYDKLHFSFAQL